MNRRFFNKLLSLAPFLPYVKSQDDRVVGYSDGSGWVILSEEYPKNSGYELYIEHEDVKIIDPDGKIYYHPNWIEFSNEEVIKEKIILDNTYIEEYVLAKIHITLNDKHRLMVIYQSRDKTTRGIKYGKNICDATYKYPEHIKEWCQSRLKNWNKYINNAEGV